VWVLQINKKYKEFLQKQRKKILASNSKQTKPDQDSHDEKIFIKNNNNNKGKYTKNRTNNGDTSKEKKRSKRKENFKRKKRNKHINTDKEKQPNNII